MDIFGCDMDNRWYRDFRTFQKFTGNVFSGYNFGGEENIAFLFRVDIKLYAVYSSATYIRIEN
jgi:hypothetical protein